MNKTAMMQLRDRLQAQLRISTNKDYQDCYRQTINLINTELLEVEKQQREKDFVAGRMMTSENTFAFKTINEYLL